jgi:hypothetical protein
MTSHKRFEKFSLLSNKISSSCYHFTQPSIHFMLVLTSCHSVQLTELLDVFMHCKHCRGESLTFLIDIFWTFYHFVVNYLMSINKLSHFTAKKLTVLHLFCWNIALLTNYVLHQSHIFLFLYIFHFLRKIFDIIIFKPFNQKFIVF